MRSFRTALILVAVVFIGFMAWRIASGDRRAGFGLTSGPLNSTFVGNSTCATCHQAEHRAWQGSHHDRAMQPARPDTVRGNFQNARLTDGRMTSTFFQRDGRFLVNTDGPDGVLRDYEIKYTFGVEPLQQYLVEFPDGRLQPLPVAWDSRPQSAGGQRWFHLYPGQGIESGDDLHWTGSGQNWNFMCADCHSTNVRKGYDAAANQFKTTWSEINVGCEACHGPGSRHVEWGRTSSWRRSLFWNDNGLSSPLNERRGVSWIVDNGTPRRSEPRSTEREVLVCAQCHSRRAQIADGYTAGAPLHDFYVIDPIVPGLYHADGQQRDEVYEHGSFMQSRMNAAGVTCADCHEPHSQQLRAPGNQLCVRCHAAATYDAPSHHLHPATSAGGQCVACHMATTTYMQIDARRDHSFRVPRPDQSVTLDVPNACNNCHTNRTAQWAADALRGRLGRDPSGFQRFAESFHAAGQGDTAAAEQLRAIAIDQTQPAIVRASALARLRNMADQSAIDAARAALSDADPTVRWSALGVLERLAPRERVALATPLLSDAARAVRIQAAWVLAPGVTLLNAEAKAAFDRAGGEFMASQRYNADRAENRLALGTFLADLGRASDAESEYQAALRLQPGYVPAAVNLADLIRRQGREPEAQQLLRQVLTMSPDDAALHHALGLSLVRAGNRAEALAELQRAATLAPGEVQFSYAYAVALNGEGRSKEALAVLENARQQHPQDRELLFALATFRRDAGDVAGAIGSAELLERLGDPRGRTLIESLQSPRR